MGFMNARKRVGVRIREDVIETQAEKEGICMSL
jgi:hypothetical protein